MSSINDSCTKDVKPLKTLFRILDRPALSATSHYSGLWEGKFTSLRRCLGCSSIYVLSGVKAEESPSHALPVSLWLSVHCLGLRCLALSKRLQMEWLVQQAHDRTTLWDAEKPDLHLRGASALALRLSCITCCWGQTEWSSAFFFALKLPSALPQRERVGMASPLCVDDRRWSGMLHVLLQIPQSPAIPSAIWSSSMTRRRVYMHDRLICQHKTWNRSALKMTKRGLVLPFQW